MLYNELDARKTALIFAHYAYRDTEVEDMHAGTGINMDDNTYDKVYEIVKRQLGKIEKYHPFLLKAEDIEQIKFYYRSMEKDSAEEFMRYCQTLISYAVLTPGSEWDPPRLLEEKVPCDLAAYVLKGAFRICCQKHNTMDDETMCYINKDVYNRFYTLVFQQNLLYKSI